MDGVPSGYVEYLRRRYNEYFTMGNDLARFVGKRELNVSNYVESWDTNI